MSFLSWIGVKVRIVRGYAFRQTKFISGYVNFCAAQRKKSTNASDKKLWKNMANIIYGKFIGKYCDESCALSVVLFFLEDPRKRVNIAYYNSFERMEARLRNHVTSMPKIINNNLVQVSYYILLEKYFLHKVLLPAKEGHMNKPIQIGFSVLERRWALCSC